jgi:hypothetical protein
LYHIGAHVINYLLWNLLWEKGFLKVFLKAALCFVKVFAIAVSTAVDVIQNSLLFLFGKLPIHQELELLINFIAIHNGLALTFVSLSGSVML